MTPPRGEQECHSRVYGRKAELRDLVERQGARAWGQEAEEVGNKKHEKKKKQNKERERGKGGKGRWKRKRKRKT